MALLKHLLAITTMLLSLAACNYNPMIENNNMTGSAAATGVGAAVGAGSVAYFGGPKLYMGLAGIGGGAIGYYVSA